MAHSLLFFSQFSGVITINTVDFKAVWKTVQLLNKPADQKPADLDLHCFLNRIYLDSGLRFEGYYNISF